MASKKQAANRRRFARAAKSGRGKVRRRAKSSDRQRRKR
jgi:hypothetical protein